MFSFICAGAKEVRKNMKYYVCCMENGLKLDFDKQCTKVQWSNDMFKALDCEGALLAIIPITNVNHFIVKKGGAEVEIHEETSRN